MRLQAPRRAGSKHDACKDSAPGTHGARWAVTKQASVKAIKISLAFPVRAHYACDNLLLQQECHAWP